MKMLSAIHARHALRRSLLLLFSVLSMSSATALCAGPLFAAGWVGTLCAKAGYPCGSTTNAVSADGKVAVGTINSVLGSDGYYYSHAFRWTEETGLVDIGADKVNSYGRGVSADGSVIVGQSGGHAFRWTQASGMINLGANDALAVSADGGVVVGTSSNGIAFRWTQGGGVVELPTLGGAASVATAVSADGNVVVGYSEYSTTEAQHYRAFRWTAKDGTTGLGTLGGPESFAYGISSNGNVIVGASYGSDYLTHDWLYAFRWTEGGGMVNLGTLPDYVGNYNVVAFGVSSDGSAIVGALLDSYLHGQEALRWTVPGGITTVKAWLTANGVDSGSASFAAAYGVSDDGNTVVGQWTGQNAYLARLGSQATLTVVKSGSGTGAVTSSSGIDCGSACKASLAQGTIVTLTATAAAGSAFAGWSGGNCTGKGTCSLTVSSDVTVTAAFSSTTNPTLSVSKSGGGTGTVTSSPVGIDCGSTCSAAFAKKTKVTLTPAPDSGSVFTGWTGACKNNGACSVTMTGDITVAASFEPGSCGYGISSKSKTLTYRGGTITLSVTATGHTYCRAPDIMISAQDTGWITYTATAFAKNKGSIRIPISEYDYSAGRTATITVGGNPFTIKQTGQPCSLSVSPQSSGLLSAEEYTGTFTVTATPTDCAWTVSRDARSSWITIDSATSGTGSSTVDYTVALNDTKKARNGKITVTVAKKNKAYTVRQSK